MTLNVADISRYQAGIHEDVLKAGGCDAVITGVTFGGIGTNPYANDEINGTNAAGMLPGGYHIRAWGSWTPQQEADHFLEQVRPHLDGRFIVALDWEECDTSDENWALAWLQYVESQTGLKPWFYVNLADLLRYGFHRIAANGNAIWLAQYPYITVNGFAGVNWQPQAIPADHTLAAWQYVGTGGSVNGIPGLDLSVAYIDAPGWIAYATPNGSTPQSTGITPITEAPDLDADQNAALGAVFQHVNQAPGAGLLASQGDINQVLAKLADIAAAIPNAVLNTPIPVAGKAGKTTTIATEASWNAANFANVPAAVWNQNVGTGNAAGVLNHIDAKPAGTTVANTVAALSPADFAALAKAVNDEADARAARRLATP